MAHVDKRTFVGFGFGAIQAGLFLYEAHQSGGFGRLVVAEVLPDVVQNVRAAAGYYSVNIAQLDRVEVARVGPIEIENPTVAADRARLVAAVAEADEIATAVPSVEYYSSAGPGSLHRILAEGLQRKAVTGGPRCVVYTAENHNHAASILAAHVMALIPDREQQAVASRVRFADTVIAKISGVLENPSDLEPIAPGSDRAFLVEAFNKILVSRISFDDDEPYVRGISVFDEKDYLLPFEEAKLYGHNAVHALAAYVGAACGVDTMSELPDRPGMMPLLRTALIEESGAALIAKYDGVDDFFTDAKYADFAGDLLARIVNPYLRDTVERVGRDPARKLEWDDRLLGTMRLCHNMGVSPHRYAFGAAVALSQMDESGDCEFVLPILWQTSDPDPEEQAVMLSLIQGGQHRLAHWRESGYGNVEALFS